MLQSEFSLACFTYCQLAHASQTSGYRTARHNERVGGKPDSPHLDGFGCDVVYDDGAPPALADVLAKRLGLEVVHEGDHDHLQPLGWWTP